jgi:hypothetical protein
MVDSRMTFVDHFGSIVSKSARILGFIKRISRKFKDPYTYKIQRGFGPARIEVCIVRVVASSRGSFAED